MLTNTSDIIAHALLGFAIESFAPATLLGGGKFDEAGVYGVVEADFFDWVVEIEGGESFIRTRAKRLGRFVWVDAEQDVLKALYESFIAPETRKRLGEYYTPDWLAMLSSPPRSSILGVMFVIGRRLSPGTLARDRRAKIQR